jgi:ectoine hydroxylase-related dioxygenase (phytanoyl-CoA dioxygenase family)
MSAPIDPLDATSSGWTDAALASVRADGFAVVWPVLPPAMLDETRERMYRVRDRIVAEVGQDRLERAGELGVLRLMMQYDAHFLQFLELPEVLAMVDATVSSTAVMHLQNGLILPSRPPAEQREVFQTRYHQDFPRVLNGYLVSINLFFAIDRFTRENGATWVVPRSHQHPDAPATAACETRAFPIECPAGSMIVFDSTLWHAAGENTSGRDRLAINHQFTRSWIKQQVDYVRALGDAVVEAQTPRTQQLLGWYTRVVTSLNEYYAPPDQRLYRKGQG